MSKRPLKRARQEPADNDDVVQGPLPGAILPSELMARVLLLVAGPSDSAKVKHIVEARRVCKRWQLLVDVHVFGYYCAKTLLETRTLPAAWNFEISNVKHERRAKYKGVFLHKELARVASFCVSLRACITLCYKLGLARNQRGHRLTRDEHAIVRSLRGITVTFEPWARNRAWRGPASADDALGWALAAFEPVAFRTLVLVRSPLVDLSPILCFENIVVYGSREFPANWIDRLIGRLHDRRSRVHTLSCQHASEDLVARVPPSVTTLYGFGAEWRQLCFEYELDETARREKASELLERYGDAPLLRKLLCSAGHMHTLLHDAIAISTSAVIIETIVRGGANIEAEEMHSRWRRTPLFAAVQHRNFAALKALVRLGANVNCRATLDDLTETPLHSAVSNMQIEAVRVLLAAGARLDALDSRGRTPRDVAPMEVILSGVLDAPVNND